MKQIVNVLSLSILLVGCTEASNNTEANSVNTKINNSRTQVSQKPIKQKEKPFVIDSTILKLVKTFDSTYSHTPYHIRINNKLHFYVCKGDWKENTCAERYTYPPSYDAIGRALNATHGNDHF